jgi:serine/threonine protein phosphatase PrpC
MNIYYTSKKGLRDQNEDQETIFINSNNTDKNKKNLNIFGIYDGHGGKFVSKFIAEKLPKYFYNKNIILPLTSKYIKKCFENIQTYLEKKYQDKALKCGSTCIMAIDYIYNHKRIIDIINLGDCRCVISKNNIGLVMTKDHKPHWPEEAERISKMGGKIYHDGYDWRIGDLSVSRAFGDIDNKPYISSVPDIFRHNITSKDQFMIIGCDGLWDVIENQEAVNFILLNAYDKNGNRIKSSNLANKLADLAIKKGSTDNVSIIIIFF